VYLVDRLIPMLLRPLCEIACSLNENVERLAFSCVWTMNINGTLAKKKSKGGKASNDVWYGRTVIKSCSHQDYATAQNIIDGKVTTGEQ
jgi:DIS3-like exonuclease 2